MQTELVTLIHQAVGGDVLSNSGGGFIQVMAKSNPAINRDIPAAFEAYSLLEHLAERFPTSECWPQSGASVPSRGVHRDTARVLGCLDVGAGELPFVAHWLSNNVLSEKAKALPGRLVMAFTIETHDGQEHLLPEWWAAYFVDGDAKHCIPLLTLPSITDDPRFADWVNVALHRMAHFDLPVEAAQKATEAETREGKPH
jgi:hypothetical protein